MVRGKPEARLVEIVTAQLEVFRLLRDGEIPDPTRTFLNLIRLRPGRFPGVGKFARDVGHSQAFVREHCLEHVGMNPRAFLIRFRAFWVFETLAHEPMRLIKQFHEDAGYASTAALSHAFRRATGLAPTVVQQALRGRRPVEDHKGLVAAAFHVERCAERRGLIARRSRHQMERLSKESIRLVREFDRPPPPIHSLGSPP